MENNIPASEISSYSEFSDPRLVALYDNLNALGNDSEFMCQIAKRFSATSIIDLGCGTGMLTCELTKRGYQVIGMEPSSAMLDVAIHKTHGDKVKWIKGSSEQLKNLQVDLIFMTSHVAQFFLNDEEWRAMLKSAHKALKANGHLVFDSRNPITKPWERWTRETSTKKVDTPNGKVEMWYQLSEVRGNRVLYEIHYLFIDSGEELISNNELIYRSREEITQSLSDANFSLENIYGDWDNRPIRTDSLEMVFVARRN